MKHVNCTARVSPVDKYHHVLRMIRNTDVNSFKGVDELRNFLRSFGTDKNAYMDAVTFLSMAELDGRLTVDRLATQDNYTSAYVEFDDFTIDASVRATVLQPGTFVLAGGVPGVVVSASVDVVVHYEVKDEFGDVSEVPGTRVRDLTSIRQAIQA